MTTVAVCGGVNWDEIWLLADDPLQHGKVEALAVHRALGGSAANTASWLAALVERVELIGAVGEDPEGRACLDWLDLAGVGCGSVEVIAGAGTSRACCWSAAASKRIVTRREPALRRDHASAVALAALASAEHLHLASTTDAAVLQCLRVAVGGGLSVSVELSGRRLDEARRHADVVFLNAAELLTVFGVGLGRLDADAVASVAPKRGATLVITNGAESVVCATAAGTQAFRVEVAARGARSVTRSRQCAACSVMDSCVPRGPARSLPLDAA